MALNSMASFSSSSEKESKKLFLKPNKEEKEKVKHSEKEN